MDDHNPPPFRVNYFEAIEIDELVILGEFSLGG